MAKSGRRPSRDASDEGSSKRQSLVDAAFQVVHNQGYSRASARAIAEKAGCNSALVFYYFESVDDLLVEALAASGRAQLVKYEAALAGIDALAELVEAVRVRVADDLASGHVKVLTELIGACSSNERLREKVFAQVTPWLTLTEATLVRVLSNHGLGGLVSARQVAVVVVSMFLGLELFTDVSGDDGLVDGLFESVRGVVSLLGVFSGPGTAKP